MRSGRPFDISGDEDYWQVLTDTVTPSRHYTFCFNLFVMLQIINFFNSRMLLDEINVFSRLHKSIIFIEIVLAIMILQAILVTFGGLALDCYSQTGIGIGGGLTIEQWFISIGISFILFFTSIILKFVPEDKMCVKMGA